MCIHTLTHKQIHTYTLFKRVHVTAWPSPSNSLKLSGGEQDEKHPTPTKGKQDGTEQRTHKFARHTNDWLTSYKEESLTSTQATNYDEFLYTEECVLNNKLIPWK